MRLTPKSVLSAMFPTSVGATLGLMSKPSGATSTQYTPPSAMDLLNAKMIAALAPYMFRQMVPNMTGVNTDKTAKAQKAGVEQGAQKASQMQITPGSAQMFKLVDSMGQPGGARKTADIMMAMYGRQPNIPGVPTGTTTGGKPGGLEMANSLAGLATAFGKAQNPYMPAPDAYQPRPIAGPNYNMGVPTFFGG